MDNAMVKRGIGAVVLAIIAALLLGYLLKDKSRERQEVVEMKLPGAPEINIPSLSEATEKVTDSAASLVGEATDTVTSAGTAVVASASGTLNTLSDSANNTVAAVTNTVSSTVDNVASNTGSSSSNPGFSFRPPAKNEEQQINDNSSAKNTSNDIATTTADKLPNASNDTVVASNTTIAKPAKKFKPRIEDEPKKVTKKSVKKPQKNTKVTKAKPKTPKKSAANGKYSIQLLATSSQSRANKLATTMNSEGYVAFITQTNSNNKILYRVRVGGHNNRAAAIKAQESMKRRYQKNFFVQNSLVVSK